MVVVDSPVELQTASLFIAVDLAPWIQDASALVEYKKISVSRQTNSAVSRFLLSQTDSAYAFRLNQSTGDDVYEKLGRKRPTAFVFT